MKKIELRFLNQLGRTVMYSLEEPIEPVDPALVRQAMDEIIAQNIFSSSGGDLVEKHSARIVDNIVEEIDLDQ